MNLNKDFLVSLILIYFLFKKKIEILLLSIVIRYYKTL